MRSEIEEDDSVRTVGVSVRLPESPVEEATCPQSHALARWRGNSHRLLWWCSYFFGLGMAGEWAVEARNPVRASYRKTNPGRVLAVSRKPWRVSDALLLHR